MLLLWLCNTVAYGAVRTRLAAILLLLLADAGSSSGWDSSRSYDRGVQVPPKPIFWMHIEKTGGSFINVLFRYACPLAPVNDTEVYADAGHKHFGRSCIFYVFPPSIWCPTSFHPNSPTCNTMHPHMPDSVLRSLSYASDRRIRVFTMFRDPVRQRMSAYNLRMGVKGDNIFEYVKRASIIGCQTKAVLGHHCFEDIVTHPSDAKVAFRLVQNFTFFGLADAWHASVRLFHSELRLEKGIVEGELGNIRRATYKVHLDVVSVTAAMESVGDPDITLYRQAAKLFRFRLRAHNIPEFAL